MNIAVVFISRCKN